MKIALCTIAAGKDPIYFESARRYLPYNQNNFGHGHDVDYILFTDRDEDIEGMTRVECPTSIWPYCTMLKNNMIGEHFDRHNLWDVYERVFFIDADFAIGDRYDFFSHEFLLVDVYWGNNLGGGFFYGGKTSRFRELYEMYKDELALIYERKLAVPHNLDEFYLGLFRQKYEEIFHIVPMNDNTLVFYDNEDLDEKIREKGARLLLHPYKSQGRANTVTIKHPRWEKESVINLEEGYVFIVYKNDIGLLSKIDDENYRILWHRYPESREVLNITTNTIRFE